MLGLPLQSLLCPITVGRSAEIDSLRAFLAQERGVLLISGEAGVGKSRLVREARNFAAASGLRVLEGRCFEADRALPFAPAVDILRGLVDQLGAPETARRAGPAAPELARLVPEIAPATARPAGNRDLLDTEAAKRRLMDGFAHLLMEIREDDPLLLVIEDIHWPDTSSLELLLHLARRTARERLFLLMTYRSDEVGPELAHLLATLDRERLTTEIPLDRLDLRQVSAMLQAIFGVSEPAPAGLLHVLYALTEGNPFFIEEVLTALTAEYHLVTDEGAWARADLHLSRIPRSVHDAVRRRLDTVSEPARDVLTLAAVAGRGFDFDLLCALSGLDEAALLELVKELVAAQLVVEEAGDRFTFRHALTREAIYGGLLERERRLLHRRIADAISELQADSPERWLDDLSAHAYAAGSWARALDAARQAGTNAASLHAPRAAGEHFTRAIESARALGLPPDPGLYRARGHAYETLGEFHLALADYETALDLARSGTERRGEWQLLLDLGLLWSSRDYRRTGVLVTQALAVAREIGDPATIARSLNRLGNWHANVEEPLQATQLHQEAQTIFEALGDNRGVAETLDLLGMVGLMGGTLISSSKAYARAAGLWEELGDRRGLAMALQGLCMQAPTFHTDTLPAVRPIEEVRDAGLRSIAICREIDWRVGECFVLWGFCGMVLGAGGQYDVALPGTRLALHIAREIEHRQWITGSRCILGNLYADLGDFTAATSELQEALTLARDIGSPYWIRSASGWLATVRVRAGDFDGAAGVLRDVHDEDTPFSTLGGRLLWCAAAELALAQGNSERALDIASELIGTAPEGAQRPIPRLEALRGQALLGLGRDREAEAALDRARDNVEWSGALPLLWRIEIARGHLYRANGQPHEAERAFAQAASVTADLAERVPDAPLRETFLALTARHPPSAEEAATAPDDRSPLTRREREVAVLLTEGLTNREIGERLYLSEWTIATHVRNILAKLDLTSRTQIAAWATSQGLVPDG